MPTEPLVSTSSRKPQIQPFRSSLFVRNSAHAHQPADRSARPVAGPILCGVDVGGTNIKIGIVDDRGRTLAYDSIATNEHLGPDQAVQNSASTIRSLCKKIQLDEKEVVRIGLGSPGTMCLKRGMLIDPPNLPNWHHFAIRAALENASGKPVSFINDANAAAYGEFWIGKGEAYESMALLTLGTGVGGGIITMVICLMASTALAVNADTSSLIADRRAAVRLGWRPWSLGSLCERERCGSTR